MPAKFVKAVLLSVGLAFVVIQLVPAAQVTNPPANGTLTAPPEVEQTLERSCFDCHSNQTQWPWYAKVAPLSWLVAHDVELGRKEINFSEWGEYYPGTRKRKLEWMRRALHEEAMPPWQYRLMHPSSRMSQSDCDLLTRWIDGELANAESQPIKATKGK